jgi:hypothetical protein
MTKKNHAPPSDSEIRTALSRVISSPGFRSSPRLSSFLSFVVETTLNGHAERIKGYTIAVEALGREKDFDPQGNSLVRVEAIRLRRVLEDYYAGAGQHDPLMIKMPSGSYVPRFDRSGLLDRLRAGFKAVLSASRQRFLPLTYAALMAGVTVALGTALIMKNYGGQAPACPPSLNASNTPGNIPTTVH